MRRAHRGRPLGKALRAIERKRRTVVKLIASRHLRQVRSGRNPTSVERNSIMDALSILTIVRESLSVSLSLREEARLRVATRCAINHLLLLDFLLAGISDPPSPPLLPPSFGADSAFASSCLCLWLTIRSAIQHVAIIRIAKYSDNRRPTL